MIFTCAGEEYTSYSLHNVHLQYQWVMRLAKHPRVLQVVKAILGHDVILLDSRFICKYPASPRTKAKQAGKDIITLASDEEEVTPVESETGLPFVAWHQDMRWVLLQ